MNRIYVFSSTGNSLAAAVRLSEKLGECELVSIPSVMKKGSWSIEGDTAGIVFPCYYGGIPRIIREFIQGAQNVDSEYIYAFVTAGGSSGYSLKQLGEALEKRGAKLSYGSSAAVASNYMNGWYYEMIQPSPEQYAERLEILGKRLEETASAAAAGVAGVEKGSFMNYLVPLLMSPSRYIRDTRPWDSEFGVTEECTGCGICAGVCPVDNIRLDHKKPVFSHNCQRCMACVQFCPVSAFTIKGRPMNKTKYRHPEITARQLESFHKN